MDTVVPTSLGARGTIALHSFIRDHLSACCSRARARGKLVPISANLRVISREDTSRWNRYFNRHSSRFLEEEDRQDRPRALGFVFRTRVSRVAGQRKINNALPRASFVVCSRRCVEFCILMPIYKKRPVQNKLFPESSRPIHARRPDA